MNPIRLRRSESGQASLVALLVALAIIGFMVFYFLFRPNPLPDATEGPGSESQTLPSAEGPKTVPGMALAEATEVECRNNLDQIRKTLQMTALEDEPLPRTIQNIDVPQTVRVCPATKLYYAYNNSTGQVYCTTPEHRNL